MKRELAVVISNDNKNVSILQTIDAISKAGFKKVFIQWYDDEFKIPQLQQLKICKEKGLEIIFTHLGYQHINEIWTSEGEYFVERYKKDIFDCYNDGVSMVVMHPCSKSEAPGPNELGLNRFKEINAYAKSLGVKIAIENTKIKNHIDYILNNIVDNNLGICFDAGHYHANFKDDWDIKKYKNRIMCVHLHDNNGQEDQHLLPFDGTLDWKHVVNLLNELNYDGPITMELVYRNDYLNMNVDDFYTKAYKTGLKIMELL